MKKAQLKFGIVFSSIIAMSFTAGFSYDLFMHFNSKDWKPTQAIVTEIRKTSSKSSELIYEYNIYNKKFIGDTFAFLSKGSIHDKDLIEKNYKTGGNVTVFINPNSPSQSVVLKRVIKLEYTWGKSIIIIFFTFLAIYYYNEYKYITRRSS